MLIHTNGDYLDRAYLEDLRDAGLDRIHISIYGPDNGRFVDEEIIARIRSLVDRLKLDARQSVSSPGCEYMFHGSCGPLDVGLHAKNYHLEGANRGELVAAGPVRRRSSPCFSPFENFNVDYRGNVLPCCNVYSDNPGHRELLQNNLNDGRSIFEHYSDRPMARWRRAVFRFSPEGFPCDTCSRRDFPELESRGNMTELELLGRELSATPASA